MKIYVIGDSISMQYGPYLERYLHGVAGYARKTAAETASLALDPPQDANGGDSSQVLAFLRAKAAAGGIDADLLLVNCGLHDIRTDPVTAVKQVAIEDYAKNLRAIVETVRGLGIGMAWIRTTPCDENVHNRGGAGCHRFAADAVAYNAVADRIMTETGVPVIDLYTFTCNLAPEGIAPLVYDHVHFHEPVREKQAAFIAGWLDSHMHPA